ncbi:fimbrial protein [Pantoea agglomerans]|uniref:fimbrial protein n=1 Tax=Enterobacter agglomerans TaxID=549 RepID=UPI002B1D93A9|nr:fimbrial protein [Pantoea agglomerans]
MKKIILASLLPVLMIGSFSSYAEDTDTTVAPEAISVDGGKINFTGSVVAAPCAVDNSSDGQSVTLGQIATNQLASKGATGSAVPFTVKLIGCDLSPQAGAADGTSNYTKASITFSGSNVDATTLQVTADGAGQQPAKNVGIQIMQANKAVNVDGTKSTATQDLIAGTNEIPFTATYVATDASVVAGSANGAVSFKVNYE